MLPGETDKDEPGEAMMSQMENMLKKVSQSALLALALATALPGVANADTYGCVSKVTDGAQKLLLAETKALAGCAISFAKGAVSNLIPCAAAFANTTVKGAQDKLVADTTAACGTTLPAFGLSSLTAPPQLAIGHSVDLYKDLFGQNPNATTLKDINGLKCQDTLRKAMGSCQDTRVKEFEACLKTASKNGSFASVAAISACLGAGGNEEPDAKGKIDKACFSAIRDKVIPVCTSLGVQTASALPGCNATTAEGAATCMKQRSLCRICTLANAMYGTTKDCDLSDDGDDANSSCPEPLACGDGVVDGNEACDDGNASNGDGCSSTCTIETGWSCGDTGCTPVHGDGAIKGTEQCDDGNTSNGDGCSSSSTTEAGYACSGQPSTCVDVCGSGRLRGSEQCDDGNKTNADGCSSTCTIESGFVCSGAPSSCRAKNCGDTYLDSPEECEQGNYANGDGCSSACKVEAGWSCSKVYPSVCDAIIADGKIVGPEQCDDFNYYNGDGCSSTGKIEAGSYCQPGEPSTCEQKYEVVLDTPANGDFTTAASTVVTGHVSKLSPERADVRINGVAITVAGEGTFSTTVALDAAAIFNPIRATVTDKWRTGYKAYARTVAIRGDSIADDAYSPQSIALRLNDTGLDKVEPAVQTLLGTGLDLGALLPVGTKVLDNVCVQSVLGACIARATVTIVNPKPTFSSFSINIDSQTGYAAANLILNNVVLYVQISGTLSCPATIKADAVYVNGNYTLQPDAAQANEYIDVNLSGSTNVSFANFSKEYTCGGLTAFILDLAVGNVQDRVRSALVDFLKDPDGTGPLDSPIADGIETALAGLTISTTLGDALGVFFKAPFFAITADPSGITLGSNASIKSSQGTGAGQCVSPAGSPKFTRSLAYTETFPTFGANTPGTAPYNLAFGVSATAFNQLLKAQAECGLLTFTFSNFDFGFGEVALTAGTVAALFPEFAAYPPETPLRLEVRPTIAPVLTGDPGPDGETTELRISDVIVRILKNDGSEEVALEAAFDARIGANFTFAAGQLAINLGQVAASNVTVNLLSNNIGVDETEFETELLPGLVTSLLPSLTTTFAGIPLPDFIGFALGGVEATRTGKFLGVYTDLNAIP